MAEAGSLERAGGSPWWGVGSPGMETGSPINKNIKLTTGTGITKLIIFVY